MKNLASVRRCPERRTARGFTLVEVLIALLVLSIGMLGIAALYLETLRASRSALVRTQAVTLAGSLADRMRANRSPAGVYNCGGTCEAGEGGNAIAIADLNAWRAAVATQLPTGVGSVAFVAGAANAPDAYTVTISWTEIGYTAPIAYQLRVEI